MESWDEIEVLFALVWHFNINKNIYCMSHFNINKNIYCMSHYISCYVYWWTLHLCLFTLINCGRKWLLVFSNLCNHQLFISSIILYLCLVTYVTFESFIWQIYYPLFSYSLQGRIHHLSLHLCWDRRRNKRSTRESIEWKKWVVFYWG